VKADFTESRDARGESTGPRVLFSEPRKNWLDLSNMLGYSGDTRTHNLALQLGWPSTAVRRWCCP
jgi:hypothetical protein